MTTRILRTPESSFDLIKDQYPFDPHYVTVASRLKGDDGKPIPPLRMHYVDEGRNSDNSDGVILCMHGEPAWRSCSPTSSLQTSWSRAPSR